MRRTLSSGRKTQFADFSSSKQVQRKENNITLVFGENVGKKLKVFSAQKKESCSNETVKLGEI